MKIITLGITIVAAAAIAAFAPSRAWAQADCPDYADGCIISGPLGQGCTCFLFFCWCVGLNDGGGQTGGAPDSGGQTGGGGTTGGGYQPPPPPPLTRDGGEGWTPEKFGEAVAADALFTPEKTDGDIRERKKGFRISLDGEEGSTIFFPTDKSSPNPQGNAPVCGPPEAQEGTEPLSDDLEFIVEETDVALPFRDVPFVFTRHYRSGAKSQTALGFGWSHSFYQRVREALQTADGGPSGCDTDHPDVFYQDARLGRTRFVYEGIAGSVVRYRAPAGVPLRLTKDTSNQQKSYCPFAAVPGQCPWTLDDGGGLSRHFDTLGDMVSIVSRTGHRQDIDWSHIESRGDFPSHGGYAHSWEDPNGYVDRVVDSENLRTVHFRYQEEAFIYGQSSDASVPMWRHLRCLSLEPDCKSPLVSFEMEKKPFVIEGTPYPDPHAAYYQRGKTVRDLLGVEFNLFQVSDANGDKTTYEYEHSFDGREDGDYNLSRNLQQYCQQAFGDKATDCRRIDLCLVSRETKIHSTCREHWYDSCMQHTWGALGGELFGQYWAAVAECTKYGWSGYHAPKQGLEKEYDDWIAHWIGICSADLRIKGEQPSLASVCELNPHALDCVTMEPLPDKVLDKYGYPLAECRRDQIASCLKNDAAGGWYAFGHTSDLRHNLKAISDGDGRRIVYNRYGTDPFRPDFDKVVEHVQGAAAASSDNTMTFEYYDLAAGAEGGGAGYLNSFAAVDDICPSTMDGVEEEQPSGHQAPAYVVVAHDIGGVARTTYFDSSQRRLREIAEDGGQTDFNYSKGYLKGVQDASGRRTCFWRDGVGRPTLITEMPSPKYAAADPIVTRMTYDVAGELIEVIHDVNGINVSGTQIVRDQFERPLAVGRAVNNKEAEWTCYQYSPYSAPGTQVQSFALDTGAVKMVKDTSFSTTVGTMDMEPAPQPKMGVSKGGALSAGGGLTSSSSVKLTTDPQSKGGGAGANGQNAFAGTKGGNHPLQGPQVPAATELKFKRSGCAANLVQPLGQPGKVVDAIPTAIIAPDGSVTEQSDFTPSGPKRIIAGVGHPDPRETYFEYDEKTGLVKEAGRLAGGKPLLGSVVKSDYYPNGDPKAVSAQHPESGDWVETTFGYDHSGNLINQEGRELVKYMKVDELGHTRYAMEYTLASANRRARTTGFSTDIHGRVHAVWLPEGNSIHSDYDPTGRLLKLTRKGPKTAQEVVESHEYDEAGLLKSSRVNGVTTSYVRDGFGRPFVTRIDRGIRLLSGDSGAKIAASSAFQQKGTAGAGAFKKTTVVTALKDSAAAVKGFGGKMVAKVAGIFKKSSTAVVSDGAVSGGSYSTQKDGSLSAGATTGSKGQLTLGTPQTVTDSIWFVRGFDSDGRVLWEAVYDSDPKNYAKPASPSKSMASMTEFAYDKLGRVIETKRWKFADGAWENEKFATTSISYNSAAGTVTTTDPEGKVSMAKGDALGRVFREVQAKGTKDEITTDYSYAPGDIVTVTSTFPHLNRVIQNNARGAVKSVTIGGKVVLEEDYDYQGRPEKVRAEGLGEHSYDYDEFGQLVGEWQVADASGTMINTSRDYDLNGRLKSVTDANGNQTAYEYDGLNRLTLRTDGLGKATFAYYPGTDRIWLAVDPSGTRRTYSYFLDGLLASEAIEDKGVATEGAVTKRSYDYTPLGAMRAATMAKAGPNGSDMAVTMAYDSLGRKLWESNSAQPVGVSHKYSRGKVTTAIVSNDQGRRILAEETASYDDLYRTTAIELSAANARRGVVSMQYQGGRLQALVYGNQAAAAFSYSPRGQVSSVRVNKGNSLIASVEDVFGADGVPRVRTRRLGAIPAMVDYFEGDLAGRLIAENLRQPDPKRAFDDGVANDDVRPFMDERARYRAYELDGESNWLARTGSDPLDPDPPDAVNRYPAVDGNPLDYDKAGNLKKGIGAEYSFNGLGQLAAASTKSGKVRYSYDPLGRRIAEDDGGGSNIFIWDGSGIVAYGPAQNAGLLKLVVGGSGAHHAVIENLGAGAASYLHAGTDGSTLAESDDGGNFVKGYSYTGYGEALSWDRNGKAAEPDKAGNRFLFQGMMNDPATGLSATPARQYSPQLGRWLSPDPIGQMGGTNLYAFVDGKPLNLADPSGLKACGNGGGGQGDRLMELIQGRPPMLESAIMDWMSKKLSGAYKAWAAFQLKGAGETMERLSAGEELALDLGEGYFVNVGSTLLFSGVNSASNAVRAGFAGIRAGFAGIGISSEVKAMLKTFSGGGSKYADALVAWKHFIINRGSAATYRGHMLTVYRMQETATETILAQSARNGAGLRGTTSLMNGLANTGMTHRELVQNFKHLQTILGGTTRGITPTIATAKELAFAERFPAQSTTAIETGNSILHIFDNPESILYTARVPKALTLPEVVWWPGNTEIPVLHEITPGMIQGIERVPARQMVYSLFDKATRTYIIGGP